MLISANSLRLLLSGAGLSSAAIDVIVGAFNVVVATVRAWFTPNVVRALLIDSALLVVTTTVILNWERISPILDDVIAEFVNVARNFASTITNFFTSVRNQARTVFAITIETLLFFADVKVRNRIKDTKIYICHVLLFCKNKPPFSFQKGVYVKNSFFVYSILYTLNIIIML